MTHNAPSEENNSFLSLGLSFSQIMKLAEVVLLSISHCNDKIE